MKSQWVARATAAAVIALSVVSQPVSAFADSNTTATPSPEATRSPLDQYKYDREQYNLALKVRAQIIKNINIAFKSACDKATQDYRAAMSAARTPDQKNIASSARKSAISAAIIARDTAINALGAEPVPPIEPLKPMRASSKNKSR